MSDEGYGSYDPGAPEGEDSGRSQYVTKKDVRVIFIVIIVMTIVGFPVFKMLEHRARRSMCRSNLGSISEAINQYASLHDERFPPLMRTDLNGSPDLASSGYPYTWASDLSDLVTKTSAFQCPDTQDSEVTKIEGKTGILNLTYGMYRPYSGFLRSLVANPDQTVLIVETSNHGAGNTYNPVPYKSMDGKEIPWDGFSVGWDTGNGKPSEKSAFVTRLAFPGTANGQFEKDGDVRHEGGILAINCSGAILPGLRPNDAKIKIRGGLPSGLWEAPASSLSTP